MLKEIIARNLKELMGQKNTAQIAREIGIPHRTLSRYLLCQQEIKLELLIKIADHFNESLDVLTGRKDY